MHAPARTVRLGLILAALGFAACTGPGPPEVGGDPVLAGIPDAGAAADSAGGFPSPLDTLDGASASADAAQATGGTPAPRPAAGASSPDGGPPAAQVPAQTALDSVASALRDIAAAQQLLLARMESLEAATAAAANPTLQASPQDAAPADTTLMGAPSIEATTSNARNLGVKIFWSLIVLILFSFLIRLVIWILETLSERSVARRLSIKWLIPITRMALWAIATYLVVLNVFQVDAQGVLAASAALGVAVGIAAQDMLKNVLGGLIVVFDQPFQVGDKVRVGGAYGEVVSIGLRSTRMVTADDDLVSIPNAQVIGEQVANSNAGQLNCQVLTEFHLPGRVDEREARRIAFEAAVTSRYVFLAKPIVVLVQDDFRTTFVTRVKVRAYVLDPRFEFLFQSDVTERAREGFRAAGLMPERDWPALIRPEETEE